MDDTARIYLTNAIITIRTNYTDEAINTKEKILL
jgi:hypothetical protein